MGRTLEHLDRIIFLGHDPATVLHHLFGHGLGRALVLLRLRRLDRVVPVSLVIALVWSRDRTGGAWYVTAVAVDWVLGSRRTSRCRRSDRSTPSPRTSRRLPHTYVTTLQDSMIQDRYTVLFDPFATHAVQTIAAFASLHVGIMVTVCLMAELLA